MPGLIRSVEVVQHTLGPIAFFRAIRESPELKRCPGQVYWSYPQWDEFYALAEEYGMNACEEHNAGNKTVTTMHFKALGHSLLMTWRRLQEAKASGQSSYEFHMQEEHRRAEEKRRLEEMEMYQMQRMRAEREGSSDSYSRKTRGGDVHA